MADVVTLLFRVVADTKGARTELTALGKTVEGLGRSFQQVGTTLTVGVTAPLLALAAASAKSATSLDQQVNLLKAFTGSAEAAEKRLAQLIATAQKTPGLTTSLAAMLDAQARVAGVAEASINRLLPVIGRLNAVSSLGDPQRFVQNLVQLVTQNFERADLKELVGQSPIAGELIKQLFNVDSPINSEAIRASAERLGIRSADAFFVALANAAANNPKLAAVTDSIGSQIEKMVDRVSVALRPLGLAIIRSITPIVEALVPIVETLGRVFASLPQPIQTTAVVLAGLAAAVGPLLLLLGALGQSIIALTGAVAAFQAASLLTAESSVLLSVALGPVGLAVAAIVAALGIAIVAWSQYEDATDRALKVSVEQIKSQQAEITQLQELQTRAEALAKAQGTSADEHAQLQSILARLDPDTRAYINTIGDEGTAIAELNRVLKEQVALKQAGLAQNLADIGEGAAELQERNAALQRNLELLQNISKTFARTRDEATLREVTTGFFGQPIETAKELGEAMNRTRGEIASTRDALTNFGAQIQAFISLNNLTTEGFVAQQLALGRTRAQVDGMVAALDAFKRKEAEAAASAKNTTSFIDQQRAAVDALVASLEKLNKQSNDQVDKQIRQIALTSRNAAEAKARLQEALKLDDDFFFAVRERQRVLRNQAALEETLDPSKKGAGRVAAQQRAIASAELKLLQQIEKEREIATRRESEALKRSFDDRLINIRDFTNRAIALEQELLKAKLATLLEEEAVAIRTAKNKTEAEAKRGEIVLKAEQARLDSELRQEELRRQRRDAEIRAEQAHQQRLEEIREIGRRATEEAIREALSRGAIGAIEAEERLIEIERDRFEEKKARLQEEFVLARANLAEQQRINDELAILAANRAAFEEEAARRIQAAQAQSVRKLQEFLRERRKLVEEAAGAQVELLQQEAEDAQRRADLSFSPQARREAIDAQLRAEQAAAELRHQLKLAQIEEDRIDAVEAANKNAALIEEAERLSNERRLAEDQRFQSERRAIREQAALEQQGTDPSSNFSIFGATDESATRFQAFGQTAAAALAQVSQAAGNMKTILTGALSSIASGLQSTLSAFILTGKGGGAAFKKLAAEVIAAVAAQSLVKAIFELAEGFAALATGRHAAAAQHFAAAKLYGVVGGVAAGLGAAIGASGGLGGGGSQSAGGFGGGASQSAGAFEQRDLRVTRGGAGGPGETVSEGSPLFTQKLLQVIEKLDNKISSMSPGDVVVVGAASRPDAIGEAVIREQRRNSDFVSTAGQYFGVT